MLPTNTSQILELNVGQHLLLQSVLKEGFFSTSTTFHLFHISVSIYTVNCSMTTTLPAKLALYATAFSRYAPLNVEPLKSDSLISADVKLALLYQSISLIINAGVHNILKQVPEVVKLSKTESKQTAKETEVLNTNSSHRYQLKCTY